MFPGNTEDHCVGIETEIRQEIVIEDPSLEKNGSSATCIGIDLDGGLGPVAGKWAIDVSGKRTYIYNKKGGQLTEKEERKGLQIVAAIHNPCRRIN